MHQNQDRLHFLRGVRVDFQTANRTLTRYNNNPSMAIMELVLGATRASQLILSVITIGVAGGTIHTVKSFNTGAPSPTRLALFTAIFNLASLIFLITSQFIFVDRYNGYSIYITVGCVLEMLNWLFTIAAWISISQYLAGPNCTSGEAGFMHFFSKTCHLERALVAVMLLLWCTWCLSATILVRLKLRERRETRQSREIELRIKTVVQEQTTEARLKQARAFEAGLRARDVEAGPDAVEQEADVQEKE